MNLWADTKDFFRGSQPAHPRTVRVANPHATLVWWAWGLLIVGAFVWPLLLVAFILGIILAAKGLVGHGVAVMLLCFVAPWVGLGLLLS